MNIFIVFVNPHELPPCIKKDYKASLLFVAMDVLFRVLCCVLDSKQ